MFTLVNVQFLKFF